jgi:hypothetical protein
MDADAEIMGCLVRARSIVALVHGHVSVSVDIGHAQHDHPTHLAAIGLAERLLHEGLATSKHATNVAPGVQNRIEECASLATLIRSSSSQAGQEAAVDEATSNALWALSAAIDEACAAVCCH